MGSSVGLSAKRHIFVMCVSLNPVSIGRHIAEYNVASFEVNVTVQPTSQIGPIPTNLFVKIGMICQSHVMPWPCCGIGIISVSDNDTTSPLAVPMCIYGASVVIGPCGACGAIYRCDAPISTTTVYTFGSEVPT